MQIKVNSKNVNVPDKDIKTFMEKYSISENEAVQLWLEDNDYLENEAVKELMEKSKLTRRYEKSEKTRKASIRERKVDENKAKLLAILMEALKNEVDITAVKNEAEFAFTCNDENYTVKLIKHRAVK